MHVYNLVLKLKYAKLLTIFEKKNVLFNSFEVQLCIKKNFQLLIEWFLDLPVSRVSSNLKKKKYRNIYKSVNLTKKIKIFVK